jgi:hypothetical protein
MEACLQRHEVVEVVGAEQHRCILCVQQRAHQIGERLVGARRYHDINLRSHNCIPPQLMCGSDCTLKARVVNAWWALAVTITSTYSLC